MKTQQLKKLAMESHVIPELQIKQQWNTLTELLQLLKFENIRLGM